MKPLHKFCFLVLLSIFYFLTSLPASAADFTSTNYTVKDPVFNNSGFSSSGNFRLFGSVGQPFIGVGDSSNFNIKSGFQYYADAVASSGSTPSPTPSQPGGGGPILEIFKKLFGLIKACTKSDLNCDGFVDIYDVGILFYWWEKPLTQPNFASALVTVLGLGRPNPDRNADKKVDIFDLSILLSDWTGR